MILVKLFLPLIYFIGIAGGQNVPKRPNIVVIVADDMGSYDMSITGMKQFYTPNIDAMAAHGTIMNNHYTPNLCTPSRAAFLTGKDPQNTGMQHSVIINEEPRGLPLNETLLSQIFQENGYKTHLVGKWHLGMYKKEHTPLNRGFDTHFGYYTGYISYFTHSCTCFSFECGLGKDFRSGFNINDTVNGKYATDLFTDEAVRLIEEHDQNENLFLLLNHLAPHTGSETEPLEAPPEIIEKFSYIKDENRRKYAAMVHKLDEGVGKVFQALKNKGILDNTIVLFYSDNGAPTQGMFSNAGSNFPLRGIKQTPWEGGIRGQAILWSRKIQEPGNILQQLMSVTDWFPTLLKAANINYNVENLDGLNLWTQIIGKTRIPFERKLVHVLDPIASYVSIRDGMFKYINGTFWKGDWDGWIGEIGNETVSSISYTTAVKNSEVSKALSTYGTITEDKLRTIRSNLKINCSTKTVVDCYPLVKPCLFHIETDPCERNNVADKYPVLMRYFENLVNLELEKAVPPNNAVFDTAGDPGLHNNTWTWWM